MTFFIKPSTTTATTTRQMATPNGLRNALCVGMNDYPGSANDLNGCVNDAIEWADVLKNIKGYNTTIFFNQEATKKNFADKVASLVSSAVSGSHITITYSGHGTNVPDLNGDESDGRDEAICLYDGNLIDDDIRDLLSKLNPEARLTFISDSCHSGTVTRAFLFAMSSFSDTPNPIPRYLPPEDEEEASNIRGSSITGRIFYPEENMNEVLIAGCLPTEYSYDASFNGKPMGAMSYYGTNIIKQTPQITYNGFYQRLRECLPSASYPQTPQLEGSEINKAGIIFE